MAGEAPPRRRAPLTGRLLFLSVSDRRCHATNRAGDPCAANPLRDGQFCSAHDPHLPADARFGSSEQAAQAATGVRRRPPSVIELLRERVEAEAEAILAPYFEALARGEGVEQRMRAAERLLDRVFGRPKQSAELSGTLSIDERRLEAEVEEEFAALVAARERNVLEPRWGARRLDSLTVDDAARLVRELRAEGKAEWTISGITKAASRIFTFALRRASWHGQNPIPLLENGERPKVGSTPRRRIFEGEELAHTLTAAREPWRTLFAVAAVTGGRMSELLALRWDDLDLANPNAASLTIEAQVDIKGERAALKTAESRRTIELPRQLAAMLLRHRSASPYSTGPALVFCARSGRALGQRNVTRALRLAMRAAVDTEGRPTFPVLHDGSTVAHGDLPTFHSFRHSAASQAIRDGEGAEEVSWMLGHRNSNVTRAVYLHEIRDAERVAERRARMEARYGSALEALERSSPRPPVDPSDSEVVDLRDVRGNQR